MDSGDSDNDQLESLKNQYEDQMDDLRRELATERSNQIPDTTVPNGASSSPEANSTDHEDSPRLARTESQTSGEDVSPRLQASGHSTELQYQDSQDGSLSGSMNDAVIVRLRSQMEAAHREEIQQLTQTHQEELQLQLDALKVTLTEVHATKLELVTIDMEKSHVEELTVLRESLTRVHREELEELQEEIGRLRRDLDLFQGDSDNVPHGDKSDEHVVGSQELMSRLSRQLSDEHKEVIQALTQELGTSYVASLEASRTMAEAGYHAEFLPEGEDISVSEAEGELATLRAKLASEFEQLVAVRQELRDRRFETEQGAIITELTAELERLQHQYEREYAELRAQVAKAQEEVSPKQENNLREKFQTEHAEELEELRDYYERVIQDRDREIKEQKLKYTEEIDSLNVRYEHEISTVKGSVVRERSLLSSDMKQSSFEYEDSDEEEGSAMDRGRSPALSPVSEVESEPDLETASDEVSGQQDVESIHADSPPLTAEGPSPDVCTPKSSRSASPHYQSSFESESPGIQTPKSAELTSQKQPDLQTKLNDMQKEIESYKEEIEFYKDRIESLRAELEEQRISELVSLRKSLEEKYSQDLLALKEQHSEELETLKQSKTEDMVAERHASHMEEIEYRHKEELEELREELLHERKVEVETIQSEFDAQIQIEIKHATSEIENAHQVELSNITKKHEIELSKLEEKYEAQLEDIQNELSELRAEQVEKSEEENSEKQGSEIEKVRMDLSGIHSAELESLKAELESNHSEQMKELRQCHEEEITELNQQLTGLGSQVEEKSELVKKLEDDLQSREKQVGTIRSELHVKVVEIEKLKQQMSEDSQGSGNLENELENKTEEMKELQEELEEKGDLIERLQSEINELEEQRSESVVKHLEEVENLKNELTCHHGEETDRIKGDYDAIISKLRAQIETHEENMVKEREEMLLLANQNKEMLKERICLDMQDEVQAKLITQKVQYEAVIATMQQQVSELPEVKEQLSAKEEMLSDLEAEKSELSQILEFRDKRSQEHEELVEDLQRRLAETEEQLASVKQGIAEDAEALQAALSQQFESNLAKLTEEHQQEKAHLLEEHQNAMDKLNEELEESVEDMKDKHKKEVADLQEITESEREEERTTLTAQHESQIQALKEVHSVEIESLQSNQTASENGTDGTYVTNGTNGSTGTNGTNSVSEETEEDDEVEVPLAHSSLRSDTIDEFEREKAKLQEEVSSQLVPVTDQDQADSSFTLPPDELEKLKVHHLEELDNLRVTIKEELLAENMRKLEEMTSELEKSHQMEIEEVHSSLSMQYKEQLTQLESELRIKESELDQSVSELEERHQTEISELEEKHRTELEQVSATAQRQLQEQLDRTRAEIASQTEDQLNAAALDTDVVTEELEAAHERELQDLRDKHQVELERLRQELAKKEEELETMRNIKEEEMDKLRIDFEARLADRLSSLRQQLQDQKQIALEQQRAELECQQEDLEQEVEKLRARVDTLGTERLSVDELEREKSKILEQHSAQMAERSEQIERITEQLTERNEELQQVRDSVHQLESRITQQREEYELILGRRDREHEEGGNLMSMLQQDLNRVNLERNSTEQTNDRLLQILSETVKVNMTTEERINRRLGSMVGAGQRPSTPRVQGHVSRQESSADSESDRPGSGSRSSDRRGSASTESQGSVSTILNKADHRTSPAEEVPHETSILSLFSDEGLDISQHLSESIFAGPGLESGAEEIIIDAGSRLQAAVERLLDMIEESTQQLHEAQSTQRDLLANVESHTSEIATATARCDDLEQRLRNETESREYLALELNKAEALLDGYASEKKDMDDSVLALEDKKESLVTDLERLQSRLHELEDAQSSLQAREADLERQRRALEDSVGTEQQGLLAENSRLNEEKRELQRQWDATRDTLEQRVRELEAGLEELREGYESRLDNKKAVIDDLLKQVEALEKKGKSNTQFLEEQAADWEQEREDYQHEISSLQTAVREKENQENREQRLMRQVQDLEEQLSDRISTNSELLLQKEHMERELAGKSGTEHELHDIIKQLENDLEAKVKENQEVRQHLDSLQSELTRQQNSNVDLDQELHSGLGSPAQQVHLADLEAQLTTARRSETQSNQRIRELEEELKNLRTLEEELTHDKAALQKQVYEQLTQISGLKSQVEDLKLGVNQMDPVEAQELRQRIQDDRDVIESREKEIADLTQQLDQFQRQLIDKDEEAQQVAAQVQFGQQEHHYHLTEATENVNQLQEENDRLKVQVQKLQEQVDSTPMPLLAHNLIEEKNAEIDHLNSQLDRVQHNLISSHLADSTKEQIQALAQQLEEKSAELSDLKELLAEKNSSLEEHDVELEKLKQSLDGKDAELNNCDTEIAELKQLSDDRETEITRLQESVEEQAAELESDKEELEKLKQLVEEKTTEVESSNAELSELQQLVQELRESEVNMREAQAAAGSQEKAILEAIAEKNNIIAELEGLLASKGKELDTIVLSHEQQVEVLRTELQQKDFDVVKAQEEVDTQRQEQISALNEVIGEKDAQLSLLQARVDRQQREISNLTLSQAKLQEDCDNVQVMLDTKEEEIERLTREMEDVRPQGDGISADMQVKYEAEIARLVQSDQDKHNVIEEKEEEIEALNDRLTAMEDLRQQLEEARESLESQGQQMMNRDNRIVSLEAEISELEAKIAEQKHQLGATSDVDGGSGDAVALQETINAQEQVISQLRHQLSQSKTDLKSRQNEFNRAIDELEEQQVTLAGHQLEEKVRSQSAELSRLQQEHAHTVAQLAAYQARAASQADVEQQLKSVQEEHKHHLDEHQKYLEDHRLHLAELEKSHHLQMSQLEDALRRESQSNMNQVLQNMQKKHIDEINSLILEHEHEIQRQRQVLDLSEDEFSVSEISHQLRTKMETNAQLDSRYLEVPITITPDTSLADLDGATSARLQELLRKVHIEGVKVLSLSDLAFLRAHQPHVSVGHPMHVPGSDLHTLQAAWEEEKNSLLAAIQALKDLLSETQRAQDSSKPSSQDSGGDWRAELLKAIGHVFAREREGLLSELRTHVVTHGNQDQPTTDRLEQMIREQEARQLSAMKQIFNADRQSLLAEIRDLRAHLEVVSRERQGDADQINHQMAILEEQYEKRERQLKRQVELVEYKVQQERVISEDLRSSLELEKSKTVELTSQLSRERGSSSELQHDLSSTNNEVARLKDALEREQNRLLSASSALEEERHKVGQLGDKLVAEAAGSKQIEGDLRAERQRAAQNNARFAGVIEKLKRDLEHEKERRVEAQNVLERERMTVTSLRRDLDTERDNHLNTDNRHKAKIAELRTAMDMERARREELNSALQRERHLSSQLRDTLDEERNSQSESSHREKTLVSDLQAMLDLERSKSMELQSSLERERHKVTNGNSSLEAERARAAEELERERATCRSMKSAIDHLQNQKSELSRQLEFENEKLSTLEADRDRIQASLASAKDRLRELESQKETQKLAEKQQQRQLDRMRDREREKQLGLETELQQLRQKVVDFELQVAEARRSEIQAKEERDLEKLKNAMSPKRVSQPLRHDAIDQSSPSSRTRSPVGSPGRDQVTLARRQLESLRQRLHLLVIRHQEDLSRMPISFEDRVAGHGRLETNAISSSLKDLLTELLQLQTALMASEQEFPGRLQNIPALNEKILRHNNELTDFITQLSDEKHELRRTLARLEEEVWKLHQKEASYAQVDQAEDRLISERASWSRERAKLTLQLHDAEKEAARLKADLRKAEIQLEREREKYLTPVGATATSDKEKMQRLYGKYLRAESFRKALVYQKKYLLVLLGGFQDCEEQTLSLIAKMGVYPSEQDVRRRTRHPRPYSRFRSAVRVVIAISRLKFLVKKWKRATRVGSPVVAGMLTNQNGASSYVPTSNSFSPPRRYPQSTTSVSMAYSNGISASAPSSWERPSTTGGYTRPHSTPPTRDRDVSRAQAGRLTPTPRVKRQILSALDPMQEPTATPPPSLSGDATPPHHLQDAGDGNDESLNNYIQRLEHLQLRLGAGSPSSRGVNQAWR